MTATHQDSNEAELHNKVLNAIRSALREEKEPPIKRILKVLGATSLLSALVAVPFLFSFRDQMTWVWGLTLSFWVLYFLIGFSLLFKPQPRLMITGVWSPFVVGRLFLVSTITTIVQIIICPSFVFLSSPLDWNPLLPLTNFLMKTGGMSLCMGFCGILFSVIAAGLGIRSVHKVAKAPDLKSSVVIFSILFASQIPVILVQICSEDLRSFAPFWIIGTLIGFSLVLGTKWGWNRFK